MNLISRCPGRTTLRHVPIMSLAVWWLSSHCCAAQGAPPTQTYQPVIMALTVTPTDAKGRVYAGETLTMAADAASADPSSLEYQFLFDDEVIQPWSPNVSCQRMVTVDDRGLHAVMVQVRDPHGQTQQATSVYVIRKPISPPSHEPVAQTSR